MTEPRAQGTFGTMLAEAGEQEETVLVPRDRLAKRFERSLANLRAALEFVPTVKIYDNSSIDEPHRLIAVFTSGKQTFLAKGLLPRWARSAVSAALRFRKRGRRR